MSCIHNEEILENIYDEIVAESIKNLADYGIYVSESELNSESIEKETYKRFEALCH
tara:strand:+ start:4433 stop:4600 length:168 start_codon:yes stop_codon:yes gene_type:complete